jgi:hypothetical protein
MFVLPIRDQSNYGEINVRESVRNNNIVINSPFMDRIAPRRRFFIALSRYWITQKIGKPLIMTQLGRSSKSNLSLMSASPLPNQSIF